MMERDRGTDREYQGFYTQSDNTQRNCGLPPSSSFSRICQIIIQMNYESLIGTKAASTEWFSTLSKWSLEEEEVEEVLIAGI